MTERAARICPTAEADDPLGLSVLGGPGRRWQKVHPSALQCARRSGLEDNSHIRWSLVEEMKPLRGLFMRARTLRYRIRSVCRRNEASSRALHGLLCNLLIFKERFPLFARGLSL